MKRLFFLALAILSVGAAGLYFVYVPRATSGDVVRISVNSWVGFGPLFVAREAGLFGKNGISVELSKLEAAADRRAALLSNRIDVLASTLDDLAVTLGHNVDAVAVGCADYSNGGDGIIAGGKIASLADLATAEVALDPGFVNHFFLLYVLDRNSLPVDRFKIRPMKPDDAGAAFLAGHIDAAVTWEPHLSEAEKRRPDAKVLVRSSQYPEAILDLFIARREWAQDNPQKLEALRKTWDEAVGITRGGDIAAREAIAREIGLTPTDVQGLLAGVRLLTHAECGAVINSDIAALSDRVVRLWKQAGYLPRDVELQSALSFLRRR